MTEYNNINITNVHNTCRACLKVGDNVCPMTPDEVNLYQNIVKIQTTCSNNSICIYCGYLLKKISKFIHQCQIANKIISQVFEEDTKFIYNPQLTIFQKMQKSVLKIHYLGPEENLDLLELKENDFDCFDDGEVFYSDDEVPLVFLGRNDKNLEKQRRRRKSKRKVENNDMQENVKSEDTKQDKTQTQQKMNKQKTLREGFSSRMVQETEEYTVIKLTKEQVMQELQEKSKSEKYQRAPYKCDKCVMGFNFEDVLRTHMDKHSLERGSLLCDICTQYCPSNVSLRGHIKSHTTRYKCKVCGAVRLSRQHLLEHHSMHIGTTADYLCDHCSFTTNKRTVIQRHVRSHNKRERHACDKCGKLFKNMETLRVHTLRHDVSKRLQCEHCTRKFIYPSLLKKHVQSVHIHKDYYCVECDVRFKSPENLKLHFKNAKRHRDDSSYKHQCPQCSQKFVTTSTLSVHLTTTHGAPKQHACVLCRRRYSNREALRSHTRRTHGDKTATREMCHICEKRFAHKSVLIKHLRTHTGERPYACTCGAAFAQPATLRAHQAAKHKKQEDQQIVSNEIANVPREA